MEKPAAGDGKVARFGTKLDIVATDSAVGGNGGDDVSEGFVGEVEKSNV